MDRSAQSVDRVTQKSVKLDPDAYFKLDTTKKILKVYLNRTSFSSSETIRWLTWAAEEKVNELWGASKTMELQYRRAEGSVKEYQTPEYIKRFKEAGEKVL